MTESSPEIHKGLAGVVVDTTSVSSVNPQTNSLLYRGYPVQELAARCSFEQVAWLLWHGELPTPGELAGFQERERSLRAMPDDVRAAVDATPLHAHPMDVLRTAVSIIGAQDAEPQDTSAEADVDRGLRLLAVLPAVVAHDQRRRRGQDPIAPREDLDHAENLLHMTFGEVPSAVAVDAFRQSMVLYAEHSFNASTFTARVITSTLSDLFSAVVGAIGALKGPLHGGANEAVMEVFAEIGDAAGADAWLDAALADKRKIMGFGHRVYRSGDSRVPTMKAALDRLIAEHRRPDLAALYDALEQGMATRKDIRPNLDFPSGPAYHLLGFDAPMFTPLFVVSRITGWTAHIVEQRAANSLIRPLSAYVGPAERHV